jgi:hypothetical protein
MTFKHSFSSDKGDQGNLLASASQLSLVNTGEIEIAGRRYVTKKRLAAMLGVTVRTLARWNATRIGPPKISIGKTVLFDLAKLPDWLASREAQPLNRNTRH